MSDWGMIQRSATLPNGSWMWDMADILQVEGDITIFWDSSVLRTQLNLSFSTSIQISWRSTMINTSRSAQYSQQGMTIWTASIIPSFNNFQVRRSHFKVRTLQRRRDLMKGRNTCIVWSISMLFQPLALHSPNYESRLECLSWFYRTWIQHLEYVMAEEKSSQEHQWEY